MAPFFLMSNKTYVFDDVSNRIPSGLSAYPVGSIYMSLNPTNPAELFGGEWTPLDEGRVLIGANASYPVNSKGGEARHTLSTSEIPSHSHDGSLSGYTGYGGTHSHTRGTMEITGEIPLVLTDKARTAIENAPNPNLSGAVSFVSRLNGTSGLTGASADTFENGVYFRASSGWSGETSDSGYHRHSLSGTSITTSTAGGGGSHNNMQPYLAVYMWYRTA